MTAEETIKPSRQALEEAQRLSVELLRNIELTETSLSSIALRAARLARLLNDFDFQRVFEYEVSGFPNTPSGLSIESWRLAGLAGRQYSEIKVGTTEVRTFAYVDSIEEMEQTIRTCEAALSAAADKGVSISSSNPNQFVLNPPSNAIERLTVRTASAKAAKRLANSRAAIYKYALRRYYELQFSGTADDIFTRTRIRVDASISLLVPNAVQRFNAVYANLQSSNPEDWSNAVHSCRRVLQDLANALFPPGDLTRKKLVSGKTISIKLGQDQFINRLVAFVEDHSSSSRFTALVGSDLAFLGDRLDAVFQTSQKGSHDTIIQRSEADRYVISTYLLIGDLLELVPQRLVPDIANEGEVSPTSA